MTSSMLEPILVATRRRIGELPPLHELQAAALHAPPTRGFAAALRANGLQVIAEVKRRSPSAGPIDTKLDPVDLASEYEAGGAAAISVLTEPEYFGGSLDDLRHVARRVTVPVLRKDFVLDAAQIWEARLAGADAVLLIVAALSQEPLAALIAASREAGVDALVEVHTEEEADRAVTAGASIIGVNNRDLTTFVTDLAVAERIASGLPEDRLWVAESGVTDASAAERMAAAGYDGVLVGEALVRSSDPAGLVAELRGVS